MSSNDNGLYDFIKGKSLFSPTNKASRKRSRSRSRGPREYERPLNTLPPPELNDPKNNPHFHRTFSNTNEQPQRNFSPIDSARQPQPTYQQQQPIYQQQQQYNSQQQSAYNPPQQPSFNSQQANFSSQQPPPYMPPPQATYNFMQQQLSQPQQEGARWGEGASQASQVSNVSQNNLWTGILSYSNSFESARVESSQCLESLSLKIRRELSNIHTKIDVFNSRMTAVLANEFRAVREKVQAVLEAAFKESDKYVQEYMKQKEAALAGELQQMKGLLEKELTKVEAMKEELGKPNWRKVAGEILTTDMEHKVEELLQRSSTLEVGKWELGDLAGYRIKNIESEIREIVRLKAT